jgi:hypothetical protein
VAGSAVDDATAAVLACSLTQLRELDLEQCELGSFSCLAAIGKLVHLTNLNIDNYDCDSVLTREGLMLLTGLTRLQKLQLCPSKEVTGAVVDEFWAAVRAGRRSDSNLDEPLSYEMAYNWEMPWDPDTQYFQGV